MEGWWAASYIVLWLLVVVLCFVVVALARQIGTLHLRMGPRGALEMDDEGPPLHEAPPAVDALSLNDQPVSIGGPGHAQLLLFISPGCHLCEAVLPSLRAVSEMGDMMPLVITDADVHETRTSYGDRRLGAPVVPSQKVAQEYRVPGTPYVVILDDMGVVRAKGSVNNLEQMEGLVDTARRRIAESGAERQAS
ncbi:MAG: methylamine dehydrogenase accessory protein MauD [Actinomycetota bacterium]|nr:methylamine dehydrogenase accessory protein MauD [Actinomycetota bacterium]